MVVFGNIVIILSIIVATLTGVFYLASWKKPKSTTRKYAEYGVTGLFALLSLAEILLLIALVSHNYSLQYVYSYSSNATSLIYRITALWAGNAGSLLFWSWFASLLSFLLLKSKREDTQKLTPQAMPIMMLVNVLFIALVMIESPFKPAISAYTDGHGLNPLLENVAMVLHPPCLLAGYVMLAVPFALAIASMIQKKTDSAWVNASRSWALASWLLLGAGNILGMWWAYVELGWGGYWAWDPVENSGLMPWLLVTAYLHSTMIERRRGGFKIWNIVLATLAFNMTIFGAYLSRSDILESVHSFGDTAMGPIFITFLIISLGTAFLLLIKNRKLYKTTCVEDNLVSNETSFLLVNIILVFSTFGIWVGTMFPFFSELLTGMRIEQNKDFFQTVNVPLYVILCFLAGVCVVMGWKKKYDKSLILKLTIPAIAALVGDIIMAICGGNDWYVLVGGFAFYYMIASTIYKWVMDVLAAKKSGTGCLQSFVNLFKTNRARYGAYITHIALAIMCLGIMGSTVYPVSVTTPNGLAVGDTIELKGYTLEFEGITTYMDQNSATSTMGNRVHYQALFNVLKNGKFVGTVQPEDIYYRNQKQWVSEIGIKSSLANDIYISLDNWENGFVKAYFTIKVNPVVIWIWIGGVLLMIGGCIAFSQPAKKEVEE